MAHSPGKAPASASQDLDAQQQAESEANQAECAHPKRVDVVTNETVVGWQCVDCGTRSGE